MNQEIKQLLLKYIAQQTSKEENFRVKNWIAFSKENELAYIRLYENYHANLASHHQFIDTDKAYQRFLKDQHQPSSIKRMNPWMAYAAILLTICSIGLLFTTFQSSDSGKWNTILVAKGKKSKFILPDGTKVSMNAGSTLKFNKDFGKQKRDVVLDGEAYFDIAKSKKNIPFIVDVAGYIVRDIGTIFKIKAYSEDGDFESLVLAGEISIENKSEQNDKIYLTKNQTLKISADKSANDEQNKSAVQLKRKVKISNITQLENHIETYEDWTKGTLNFDNTGFDQIVNTLEREFDITIEIKDESLKSYHYSGNFENIDNAYKILDVIKQNTPITYSTIGKTIIIQKLN